MILVERRPARPSFADRPEAVPYSTLLGGPAQDGRTVWRRVGLGPSLPIWRPRGGPVWAIVDPHSEQLRRPSLSLEGFGLSATNNPVLLNQMLGRPEYPWTKAYPPDRPHQIADINALESSSHGAQLTAEAVRVGLLEPASIYRIEYGVLADPAWRQRRLDVELPTRAALDRSWWASEWGWTLAATEEEAVSISNQLDRVRQQNAYLPVLGHVPGPQFSPQIGSRLSAPLPLVLVEQYAWLHLLEASGDYAGAWWDDGQYPHYSHARGLIFESWRSDWRFEEMRTIADTDEMDVLYHNLPRAPRGPRGEIHRYASWGELEDLAEARNAGGDAW